jgi:hypothetical protein
LPQKIVWDAIKIRLAVEIVAVPIICLQSVTLGQQQCNTTCYLGLANSFFSELRGKAVSEFGIEIVFWVLCSEESCRREHCEQHCEYRHTTSDAPLIAIEAG